MRTTWLAFGASAIAGGSLLALACSSSDGANSPSVTPEASTPEASSPAQGDGASSSADASDASSNCPSLTNDTPQDLACTGLYADLSTKQIATGLREYTPAVPLWSDGADKTRWIYLPPGTTIDATDATEWTFPVGTKLWKEFRVGGHRIETRLFQKLGDGFWVHASYQWSADELSATRADGADFTLADGNPYHIPTPSECSKCHNGRKDQILGFDAVSLGMANAAGVTLANLAKDGLLVPVPTTTTYQIADGTGLAAKALGWLNINCGVTCHNDNTTATAYGTGLRFRLDPAQLDGGPPDQTWEAISTTIGVGATTPTWSGQPRIAPGRPDRSLVVQLIDERGTQQMPPIDSLVVDTADVQSVKDWISSMDGGPPDDGGFPDGGFGRDGGPRDRDGGGDGGP
jgi:hypothetical protein